MFVSFRLIGVESMQAARTSASAIMYSVKASRFVEFATPYLCQTDQEPEPASISDATIQMDHNTVVLFTIDRLARSPRTTVRTRGTELAPDRWFIS
jgi:hypothetical protein